MHFSGKFEMSLDHFSEEAVSVDIYQTSRPDKFTGRFFADIKGDEAVFKDRTDPNCKVLLKNTSEGIIVTDHCGGNNNDTGLYKRTHKGNP